MSLQLKELPYEIDGRQLVLRCNMSVLADLQDSGDISALLDDNHSMRNFLKLLSAMINAALKEAGCYDYYTPDDLGARLSYADFKRDSIPVFDLFLRSVIPEGLDDEPSEESIEEPTDEEKKE